MMALRADDKITSVHGFCHAAQPRHPTLRSSEVIASSQRPSEVDALHHLLQRRRFG
jgi:hypothetical protein